MPHHSAQPAWQFWIDVGGTFTDCIGCAPNGTLQTRKVLSSGVVKGTVGSQSNQCQVFDHLRSGEPSNFYRSYRFRLALNDKDAAEPLFETKVVQSEPGELVLENAMPAGAIGHAYELIGGEVAPVLGIRSILGMGLADAIDEAVTVAGSGNTGNESTCRVRLGTTRGTNALLERKGARVALMTTQGFGDLATIGTQARPHLFELNIRKPAAVAERVVELRERITATGDVLIPIDPHEVDRALRTIRNDGIESIAICFLNAYANPVHEQTVRQIASDLGFKQVSVSTELTPTIRMLDRCDTTIVDAYLSPVIRDYVKQIRSAMPRASLKLMTSSGGLIDADSFAGKDSILSGPAGGVVGFAGAAIEAGYDRAIGFDMGGTSTDVSRFDGEYDYQFTAEKAGVRIVAPMYAIETVAAGGGSICAFDGVRLAVGPHSAGADPGPACYGKGGPLTVTDINLFNGKIQADQFPFALDVEAVRARLQAIADQIARTGNRPDEHAPQENSLREIADGFTRIANEKMAGAIRSVSAAKGYNPKDYPLVAFGGAAGQHACAIADLLGIDSIVIHPYAGILSAYGVGLADVRRFAEQTALQPYSDATRAALFAAMKPREQQLMKEVENEGVSRDAIRMERLLDMRYAGESSAITVREPADGNFAAAFHAMHKQLYGHTHDDRAIEIVTLRIEVVGASPAVASRSHTPARTGIDTTAAMSSPSRTGESHDVVFDGKPLATRIYSRDQLGAGDTITGPAVITEALSTTLIDPAWSATVAENGDLRLGRAQAPTEKAPAVSAARDPIQLELFNNHFTQIATQMGITLQRTSLSVNVKERLDFSCAILDRGGDLVVNAPHIPVHLGAMSATVKALLAHVTDMQPGDVYATNDPDLGGSHLPDITVMTPVFDNTGEQLRFFTASRAHHAEIGGLRPGSAFPFAGNLAEEGVLLRNVLLQRDGVMNEPELRALLTAKPYPSRSPDENVADIRAAIAANQTGLATLQQMIQAHTWPVVDAYMKHIRDAANEKTSQLVSRLPRGVFTFDDQLDDGAPIGVRITVGDDGMTIAFTAGPPNANSLNANPAIVESAVLYCVRCLIGEDIPLNSGVLQSIQIIIPRNTMLDPAHVVEPTQHVAVVGGNVELSQRIVDIVFGALGTVAASQGTMNNLVFGNERFGYYETIGGGAGAGSTFDGASGVHTHMTNTRLTDPEIMEHHYPVRVQRFAIREGSGGQGKHRGGDGIVREIEFLEAVEVSLLTQRRTRGPFGLNGGEDGKPGRNTIIRAGGNASDILPETIPETLPGLAQFDALPGDRLIIETPGGGGYGNAAR